MTSYTKSKLFCQRLSKLVKGLRLGEVLMHDYKVLQGEMTVQETASLLMNCHSKYFIMMEGNVPVGLLNRIDVIIAIAEMRYKEKINTLPVKELIYLDGGSKVSDVLDKLAQNIDHIYPVIEGGRFIGVVNYQHIIEFLLLHKSDTLEYDKVRSLAASL